MSNPSPLLAIRRRWWIMIALALVGALLGAIPEPGDVKDQATAFSATHTMLANDSGETPIVAPSQVGLFATTGEVPLRVAESIGYSGDPAVLASEITAEFDFDTSALTISTTQETAEQAELIADTFAEELNAYLAERQDAVYQDRVAGSRERLDELRTRLNAISILIASTPDDPTLLAERDAVSRQYSLAIEQNDLLETSPDRLTFTTLANAQAIAEIDRGLSAPAARSTRALMGGIVGLVLGAVIAVILGRLDRKIRTREQAEELVAMRARATIPKIRRTTGGVVVAPGRHDPLSDAYRTVRNLVGFVESGLEASGRARVTLVVSPGPGDGKTSLAANLAAAFLETGQRTIAVNTDFRRPRLHEAIMGRPSPMVPFDLGELDDVPRRILPFDTNAENMKIVDLSTVHASPGELVRASIRQIERLSDSADQIVVDTSPVGATAEVLDLVPFADVIVLVTRVGQTSITSAERTIAILRDIATAPIVFVLGGIKAERNPYHVYSDRPRKPSGDIAARPEPDEHAMQ